MPEEQKEPSPCTGWAYFLLQIFFPTCNWSRKALPNKSKRDYFIASRMQSMFKQGERTLKNIQNIIRILFLIYVDMHI